MTSPREPSVEPDKRHPACTACSKSKRKCSRQLPSCRRCRVQNLSCAYPPITVTRRARLPHSPQSLTQSATRSPPDLFPRESSVPLGTSGDNVKWFLAPASWDIDHVPTGEDDRITYPDSGLEYFLDQLRLWLDQWMNENHCAFIHPRLYASDLPSPLQHALAAWRVYRAASTTTSQRIALHLATDWSRNLIQETSMADSLALMDNESGTSNHVIDKLARVQALLVFQVIGLFDGHVRARGHAESVLSTLTTWADALLQSAAVQVAAPAPRSDPSTLLNQPRITQLRSNGTNPSTWRAWILSESIRRVWIVATLTEAAFLIMKQGFARCPGSIAFTGRSGVWDASSPREWVASLERKSATTNPVFCRGLDRLLEETGPSDVDGFTHALLAYGRGREPLEDWTSFA